MLLSLELLFVRERVLSCPFLSADDIDMFVDFIFINNNNIIIIQRFNSALITDFFLFH